MEVNVRITYEKKIEIASFGLNDVTMISTASLSRLLMDKTQ